MRKWIAVLAVVVLAAAAGAGLLSLSAPVLDEEADYTLTALYRGGREISGETDGDVLVDLLRDASRSMISRGGLPRTAFAETVEIDLQGEEGPWHIVLCDEEGVYAAYEDADWCYPIRDGEALARAVEALLQE